MLKLKRYSIPAAFVLLKFFLTYALISTAYDLHRDEYLHLDQANHLAWGYMSVPPMTSWISYIIQLLGNGVFWVKFFPALFGSIVLIIVWKTIMSLGGNLFAQILGLSAVLFSALLRIDLLYQPNSIDVLAWTSFLYVTIQYIKTNSSKYLFIGALVFALGFLNKYNISFLLLGLFPAIIFSNERKVFLKKELYLAIGLALLIILPNIAWQFNNGFPVLQHMKELAETQLVNVDRVNFLKEQLLFFTGGLPLLVAALVALFRFESVKKLRPLGFALVSVLAIFTYLKAKAYYAIGLYPIYLCIGAVYLEFLLNNSWKRYLRPVLVLLPILVFALMFRVAFPNKTPEYIQSHPQLYQRLGLLRWEDGKNHEIPQDFADMLGWKQLAYKVDSLYQSIDAQQPPFIICDNYGQAGAINYYSSIKGVRANSFDADYLNWMDTTQPIHTVIMIEDASEDINDHKNEERLFEKVSLVDSITTPFARERGTRIYLLERNKVDVRGELAGEMRKRRGRM